MHLHWRPLDDCVLFASRVSELRRVARLILRRSRRETESEKGAKWRGADPKPGELPLARLKFR